MNVLGGEARKFFEELSPHLDRASSKLSSIIHSKPKTLEPEERLEIYLRLRGVRRKMGLPDPEDNGLSSDGVEG